MLASLSTRRSGVRIPSGALEEEWESARYANRHSGQAQTLVSCGFDPHPCQVGSGSDASAGHWRAQVAVTHPPLGALQVQLLPGALRSSDGSARWSIGKDTGPSSRRGGFDSRTGYSLDSRYDPIAGGRCPAEPHKLGWLGSTPRPATLRDGRVGKRQSRQSEGLVLVGSTPTPATDCTLTPQPVPSSSGQDACLTNRIPQVRVLPGRLAVLRSASVTGGTPPR